MFDGLIGKVTDFAGKGLGFLVRVILDDGIPSVGRYAEEDHVAAIALADPSYKSVLQHLEALYSERNVIILPDKNSKNADFPDYFQLFVHEKLAGLIYNDPRHEESTRRPFTDSGLVDQAARFLYDLRYQVHFNTTYTNNRFGF